MVNHQEVSKILYRIQLRGRLGILKDRLLDVVYTKRRNYTNQVSYIDIYILLGDQEDGYAQK